MKNAKSAAKGTAKGAIKGPKGVRRRKAGRPSTKSASSKGRRPVRANASARVRKRRSRKPETKPSILEQALTGALASVGRSVLRAADRVTRASPSKPAGRPKPLRDRAPERRPGSTEARRGSSVRRPAAVPGVAIRGPFIRRYATALSDDALAFLAALHRRFDARRRELLSASRDDALPAPMPVELAGRCIAITDIAVVDVQGDESRSFSDRIAAQLEIRDAGAGLQPRGWQHAEEHLIVDRQPVAAALFDVGLYLFLHAQAADAGSAPRVVLPDGASHAAQLWNEVFLFAEARLGLAPGTIKVAMVAGPA